jgi:uncharacterized membrane protein YbhN (UPF0104 family)
VGTLRREVAMKPRLMRLATSLRGSYLWLEDKPLVILIAAAGATVGVVLVLASDAGWPHVWRLVHARHSWAWLAVCLVGELAAYGGYVLTVRAMARVDGGNDLGFRASIIEVIAGFGVFAATRSAGGFAVDYWAFREAGADRRQAVQRVLGLSFLEYAMLSIGALVASTLLFFGVDGHASDSWTLPSLIVVPVFALALWLTSPKRAERLSRPPSGRLREWFADSVAGAATVRHLVTSPAEHGLGVLGNALYWAGDILCLWAALRLFNAELSVAALVLGYSAGYVLTRRALPAGGAGFVEFALTLALVGVGLPFAPALLGVVVYRLFNFWLPIVPAIALMPTIRELRERSRQAERAV